MLKTPKFIWNHPLNAPNRTAAIWRYVRWQFLSRVAPGRIEMPFVNQTMLFMRSGMTGATGNYYCGLHEADEMGFTLHFLRAEDLFLDIGANIGSFSVLASGAVGATAVAIEPIPHTFCLLKDNLILNHIDDRVECHGIGIAAQAGRLNFTNDRDTMNHISDEVGENIISVPVRTVDQVLMGRVPKLIKIDVEGYECDVLLGAQETLRSKMLDAIIMETNGLSESRGCKLRNPTSILIDHGFTVCSYDVASREITPGCGTRSNTIFIRDLESARARVKQAPSFKLVNGSI